MADPNIPNLASGHSGPHAHRPATPSAARSEQGGNATHSQATSSFPSKSDAGQTSNPSEPDTGTKPPASAPSKSVPSKSAPVPAETKHSFEVEPDSFVVEMLEMYNRYTYHDILAKERDPERAREDYD